MRKVSVITITYNHENFIAEAIDSVLMQEVDFEYEIVIGEDCSSDHTRDILLDYQKRFPDKIRLLLPTKNLGGYKNFVQTLSACEGQYIAILDGDDYWTSPHKLQKQVDFLDSHPDYVICFHDVLRFYDDGHKGSKHNCPPDLEETLTIEALLGERSYILPVSVMFRNGLMEADLPEAFRQLQIADWPRFVLLARYGPIGYINETMGVYRIHSGGIFSCGGWEPEQRIRVGLDQLACYNAVNEYLAYVYDDLIRNRISEVSYALGKAYGMLDDWSNMRKYFWKSFRAKPFNHKLPFKFIMKLLLRSFLLNRSRLLTRSSPKA